MTRGSLLVKIRNRVARVQQRRWRAAAYRSDRRHIVMGGAPRSGTTFLRKVLDQHPEVRSGAETKLFVPAAFNLAWLSEAFDVPADELETMRATSASQAAFIDAFAQRVTTDAGKTRWAEKTPQNIQHLEWITQRFPEASIVHILRDGRDVISSMRQHPDWRWVDGAWQKVLVERPLQWYAQRWLDDTAAGMAWRGDPRYTEVRYEDLVAEPRAELARISEGIGISPDAGWLDGVTQRERDPDSNERPDYEGAVSGASVGRWKSDLAADEQRTVERLCGSRLSELGYEV